VTCGIVLIPDLRPDGHVVDIEPAPVLLLPSFLGQLRFGPPQVRLLSESYPEVVAAGQSSS